MVLAVIVTQVATSWAPVNVEHALLGPVLDPVEVHVNGLGALLLHGAIGEAAGRSVVDLDGGGRLGVPEFDEGLPDGHTVLAIHVAGPNFSLSS